MSGNRGSLWTGALAGYAASRTMDAVTALVRRRQGEASRAREEEPVVVGLPLALTGRGRRRP